MRLAVEAVAGEVLLVERCTFECGSGAALRALAQGRGASAEASWGAVPRELRHRALALQPSTDEPPEKVCGVVPLRAWARLDVSQAEQQKQHQGLPSAMWLGKAALTNAMAVATLVENSDGLRSVEALGASGGALFALGALMNHSCAPNASRIAFPGWLVMRAARPVAPGEEITMSYIDVRKPLHARREELRSKWGFVCRCERCALEEAVWSAKDAEQVSRHWERFQEMLARRQCEEADLARIVSETSRLTDRALERHLASCGADTAGESGDSEASTWRRLVREATGLSSDQRVSLCAGREPKGQASVSATAAFRRLRSALLASYCLAPSFEYANGLRCTGRAKQSLDVWASIVASVREVMPNSVVHAANALQRAVVAVEAGSREIEVRAMLLDAIRVVDAAYGGGAEAVSLLLGRRLRNGTGVARGLGEALEAARRVCASTAPVARAAHAETPGAATPPAAPAASAAGTCEGSSAAELTHINISGKSHKALIRLDRSCAVEGADILVVEVADVEDLAALRPLEASLSSVRIGGEELPLPCRIDVESATTRWSRRSHTVRLTALVRDPILS